MLCEVHTQDRPLLRRLPRLGSRLPFVALGDFPTPIDDLAPVMRDAGLATPAFVKRDDRSSPVYGGNKVRTLEVLFAEALEQGATHVVSTGAFGTNHGVATALHAPRVGLDASALLFPQPASPCALENFEVLAVHELHAIPHWSALPPAMLAATVRARLRHQRTYVMVPGGATPRGALGYVNGALELAEQVAARTMPEPRTIVLGVGSTCTTAGLLVGVHVASRLGLGFRTPPTIHAVRVTPWPVTSAHRIVGLAVRASRLLAELAGDARLAFDARTLARSLRVDGSQLGRGYGHATEAGRDAITRFAAIEGLTLDTTYSGKAAAGLLALARRGAPGPLILWSTKSTAPLPSWPSSPGTSAASPTSRAPWWTRPWVRRASHP
jgi:D-cysteine desulfhydrase